jgi:N4-gp56 family major capsid protein
MAIVGYSALSDLDRAKYNSEVRILAASKVLYPQFFAQKNIEPQSHTAVFTIWNKLAATPSDTLLTTSYSITNPTPTTTTEAQVTVTAYEYGNSVCSAQAINYTGIVDVVEAHKQLIATNLAEGLDNVAAYYVYAGNTVAAGDAVSGPLTTNMVWKAARDFENTPVPTFGDGLYAAIASPMTKYDMFDSSDIKGFIPLQKYTHPELAYKNEIGAYGGFRWAVGPSAYHATVASERHDYPVFFGPDAFGQANGYDPEIVIHGSANGNSLDAFDRFYYIAWKAQRGYNVICTTYARQFDVVPTV